MYLEKEHGIIPLPVIHFGTPWKWLERYLARGYDYIALGGLGQEAQQGEYITWADQAFNIICGQPSRLPICKVHGFAMTAHKLMVRYPWWSVDSTTWSTFAAYGQVITPPWFNGEWCYYKNFDINRLSVKKSVTLNKTSMLLTIKKNVQAQFFDYIAEKGFEIGESRLENGEEIIVTPGLVNDDKQRCVLNAIYFIDLAEHLPKWPWPFQVLKNERFDFKQV
jgi:hypothetical protein